jgi:single stranded DNA-binding protein
MKTTAQGLEIASTSVAVNHYKGRDKESTTSWFRVTVFGKGAESLRDWRKGDYVIVSGDVELREFTGRDGNKASSAEINARSWTNVSKMMRARETSGGGASHSGEPRGWSDDQAPAPRSQGGGSTGGGKPAPSAPPPVEDDLPF